MYVNSSDFSDASSSDASMQDNPKTPPTLAFLPSDIIHDFWNLLVLHLKTDGSPIDNTIRDLDGIWRTSYVSKYRKLGRTLVLECSGDISKNAKRKGFFRNLKIITCVLSPWRNTATLTEFCESFPAQFVDIKINSCHVKLSSMLETFIGRQMRGPWLQSLEVAVGQFQFQLDKEIVQFCSSDQFRRFSYGQHHVSAKALIEIYQNWRKRKSGPYSQTREILTCGRDAENLREHLGEAEATMYLCGFCEVRWTTETHTAILKVSSVCTSLKYDPLQRSD